MATIFKPKSFGPVFALYDGTRTIQYAYRNPEKASAHPPTQTPVDTMLASLASCILKSVEWVAGEHGAALKPFTVKVTGQKAPDQPNRVDVAHITIIGAFVDDAVLRPEIVAQAKSICTVSNTLNCAINVTLEAGGDA